MENLLKISELAERAGVSIPTVRYYLQEGLLPAPIKTGKTMAYYDPVCIERIKRIKRLQKERFLPIEVIKRLISDGEASPEDSEIGQVIAMAGPSDGAGEDVPESEVAERTGYPAEKIARLARAGLIGARQGHAGPAYDAVDCELIALAKDREEAGIPLEFSITDFTLYEEAIAGLVSRNTRRFLFHMIEDVPMEDMGRLLRGSEVSLDRLVVLLRRKAVRRINNAAVGELNDLARRLMRINIFPIPGRLLPAVEPATPGERILYHLCAGRYPEVLEIGREPGERGWTAIAVILACLLLDENDRAVDMVDRLIREPGAAMVDNCLAALAYICAIASSSGITLPLNRMKKAWPFLLACERATGGSRLFLAITKYVGGAIYHELPGIFGLRERGLAMLLQARTLLADRRFGQRRFPKWFTETLEGEIVPIMEQRVNRMLADGCAALLAEKNTGR